MAEFHNPYHFVPLGAVRADDLLVVDFDAGNLRHVRHDRFVEGSSSGRIVCRLTTKDPVVVGAKQARRRGHLALVDPYEIDNRPALPASSLRGLISSIGEAASNSALRVLDNRAFSYRVPMDEGLPAIGMVFFEMDANGGVARRLLQALTLPHMPWSGTADPRGQLGPGYERIFGPFLATPTHRFLKVFIEGYQPNAVNNHRIEIRTGTFLDNPKLVSYSADHNEFVSGGSNDAFWYMKLPGTCQVSGGFVSASRPRTSANRDMLLGQQPDPTSLAPISEADYLRLEEENKAELYTRGILRVLGVANRASAIPTGFDAQGRQVGKKYEIFIPYPPENDAEGGWPLLEIPPAVWKTFHDLADDRTDTSWREDASAEQWLPFHLQGSGRNGGEPKDNRHLRLRERDLVFFSADSEGRVAEIAVSSIWRRSAGDCHAYFPNEMLPFHPKRETISIAEQLFGFVEVRDKSDPRPAPARALAGRVRFSPARLTPTITHGPFYEDYPGLQDGRTPLKILASPKTPCPVLYFKDGTRSSSYTAKKDLTPATRQPQGRKYYLHRSSRSRNSGEAPWVTGDPDRHKDQKNAVRPIKTDLPFYFHIDFENLSKRELGLICYSLAPASDFHHKIGMGKPLGLGTIRIEPVGIFFVDRQKRYGADSVFAMRYHAVSVEDRWCQSPLSDQWKPLYPKEFRAACTPQFRDAAGYPRFSKLRDGFQATVDEAIRAAIERLGSLNVEYEVHYPRQHHQQDSEGEQYRWFSANDRADRPDHQRDWLIPIDPEQPGLPTLEPN